MKNVGVSVTSLVIVTILAGCSGMPVGLVGTPANPANPATNPAFRKDLEHMPIVALIGDQTVASWATDTVRSQNPLWRFYPAPDVEPETSGATLLRLAAILDTHPDVLLIYTGTYDMDAGWRPACGDDGDQAHQTCNNINSMVTLAHKAGVKVLVSALFGVSDGPAGTPILTADPVLPGDIANYNRSLTTIAPIDPAFADGVVSYDGVTIGILRDGLNLSDAGALAVTSQALPVIAALHVGGVR